MSDEKTVEELSAELERLKKENLEREIAIERAKIDAEEKLKKEKEETTLREKIHNEEREKVLTEMKDKSKVTKQTPEVLKQKETDDFKSNFITHFNQKFEDEGKKTNKHQYTGLTYEERIKKLVDGNISWKRTGRQRR